MGNGPKPRPDRHNVTPQPIHDPEPQGDGGVVVDELPLYQWTFILEDLTAAAERVVAGVAARGEAADPRFRVYVGRHLIGFVPIVESAEIREAMRQGATGLLGQVSSTDFLAGRVAVTLRLEGR